jgi:excisionase family DNA binding protein
VKESSKTPKRLYTVQEAAIYLGRSEWSVRRLIWSGELPSVRLVGRVHVDIRDMDSVIEQNKVREAVGAS